MQDSRPPRPPRPSSPRRHREASNLTHAPPRPLPSTESQRKATKPDAFIANVNNTTEVSVDEKKEIERNKVVKELLETERVYVKDLQLVVDKFIQPIRKRNIISQVDSARLFSNIEIILPINAELLSKLEKRFSSSPSAVIPIGDLFLETKDGIFSSAYIGYCNDQSEALKAINTCKKKSTFASFLKEVKEDPECRSLDLVDFIMKPVQRVTKYPLILKEALKNTLETHPDYASLKTALESMTQLVDSVNATNRESENLRSILEIESALVGADSLKLMRGNRKLIRKGFLKKIYKGRAQPRQFWLFNDLLLYAKPHMLNKNMYDYKGLIPMDTLIFRDITESDTDFEITRTDRNKTYRLSAKNSEQKMLWINSLKSLKEGQGNRTSNQDDSFIPFKLSAAEEDNLDLLSVQDNIEGLEKIPASSARKFIKEGDLDLIQRDTDDSAEKKTLHFFLFNDFFVYTEPQNKKKKFVFRGAFPLNKCVVLAQEQSKNFQYTFEVARFDTKKVLNLCASSSEEKEDWMTCLDERIEKLINKDKESTKKDPSYVNVVKESRKSRRLGPTGGSHHDILSELQKVLSPEVISSSPATMRKRNELISSNSEPRLRGETLDDSYSSITMDKSSSFRFFGKKESLRHFSSKREEETEHLSVEVIKKIQEVDIKLKQIKQKTRTASESDDLNKALKNALSSLEKLLEKI